MIIANQQILYVIAAAIAIAIHSIIMKGVMQQCSLHDSALH
jgi:hypothetical protein